MKANILAHLQVGVFITLTYLYIIYRLYKFHKRFKFRTKEIIHTDLGTLKEDGSIIPPKMKFKTINKKKALRLIKYNPKASNKYLLSRDLRDELGNIFNEDYVTTQKVKKSNGRKPEYIFIPVNDNTIYYKKERLPPYNCLLGYDELLRKITLDMIKYFAILIYGSGDSGKSVLLSIIIDSVHRSLNQESHLLILNAKRPEDDPALGYLKESKRVTWLNPLIEKELDKAIEIMSEIHSEFKKDKKDRKNLKKYIFVLEEAGQYLKIEKSDDKEITEKKRILIRLVKVHAQLLRFTKIPLIISTQGATESEIDIPKSYFKAFISGKMSSTMSKILTGDSNFLDDVTLTRGRFGVNISGNLTKFKAPIMKSIKDSSFYSDTEKSEDE